jgi:peptide/nickel transport system substrate-binding protein
MRRPGMWLATSALVLGAVLLGAAGCGGSSSNSTSTSTPGGTTNAPQGGVLKAAWHGGIDFIDPALAYYQESWQIEYVTCVKLLNYPDATAPAGYQIQPEAASAMPAISSDGLTYTFTVPAGKYKFDTGEPVTAQTFADTLKRDLDPKQVSPFVSFVGSTIKGASTWKGGSAPLAGVQVSGDQLILHLTKPNATLVAEMATPFMCAVPKNTPVNSKGVTSIAGAGPYYISSYTPNQSLVLKRNKFYHGPRPHNLSEIDFTQFAIDQNQGILETKSGQLDYCPDCVTAAQSFQLNQQFGAGNPSGTEHFYISPLIEVNYYALNTANKALANPLVRQAINYAIDRTGMTKQLGYKAGVPTDKYLPPQLPGASQEQNIYPMQPDLAKAQALMTQAKGQGVTTPINVLVYSTQACQSCTNRMALLTQELKPLGINVKVKYFQRSVQFQEEGVKGTPNDIADEGWLADFPDPYDFLNILLSGHSILSKNGDNFAYFNDASFNNQLDAAALKTGADRAQAYGSIATDMAKTQAPWAAWSNQTNYDFFGPAVGCALYQPTYGMDYASLCLQH